MRYNLIITEHAEELLNHILDYLLNQLKNPQAVGNLLDSIEIVYSNLESNPKMYAFSEDAFLKVKGYRKALVPNVNYIIIFRIEEEHQNIFILGFFHDLELYHNKLCNYEKQP